MSIFGWRLKLVLALLLIMAFDDILMSSRTILIDILVSIVVMLLITKDTKKGQ